VWGVNRFLHLARNYLDRHHISVYEWTMAQFLDPARSVIRELGGPIATAELLGVNLSTVYRWMAPAPKGSDGWIPQRYVRTILREAKKRKLCILATDFVPLDE